tara:strand:- start:2981 stop:4072 length:1092 start_codon:yes stop_codon:yes gene_type:complete
MLKFTYVFLSSILFLSLFAIKPFVQASDGSSEYEFGVILYDLSQDEKDFSQAEPWFRFSAEKGFTPAKYMLGRIYQEGNANFKNLEKSYLWYKLAAEDLLGEENGDSADEVPIGAFSLDFESAGSASSSRGDSKVSAAGNTEPDSNQKTTYTPLRGGTFDHPPRETREPSPILYVPRKMAGVQGEVYATFNISEQGRVSNVRITKSTHPEFSAAVSKILPSWRYRPAEKGGSPVAAKATKQFDFDLSPKKSGKPIPTNAEKTESQVFDQEEVDKLPSLISWHRPTYPYSLKNARIGGYAEIEFVIGTNGKVLSPRAVDYSNIEFNQPAIEAIRRSKWKPAIKDGKNVQFRKSQKVNFIPPSRN